MAMATLQALSMIILKHYVRAKKGHLIMKDISAGTITRTVLLAFALINQLLTASGHSIIPIDDATITQFIAAGFTIVTSLMAFWKNNSFTKNAQAADQHLKDLNDNK